MNRQLSTIGRRFIAGVMGVLLMVAIFINQNPEIRGNLPFLDVPLCTRVQDWNRESNTFRSPFMLDMLEIGPFMSWKDDDYTNVISQIDEGIVWLGNNPSPSEAEAARESYVESLQWMRAALVDGQGGAYATEREMEAAVFPFLDPLVAPASSFVEDCQS